ncbi:hypothetical protein EI94DRAFT_1814282 [Lactarius quietus]|nr:hypothetical protein EI94DRAFT_1814282 [Lactarius quietus]
MLFRIIAAVASVAFISQGALAQLTIPEVVTNINDVTTISGVAASTLSSISPQSSPDDISEAAQTLASNFKTIINDVAGDTTAMESTPQFTDCSATAAIVTSLSDFVTVHQNLLSVVIGKHGIMAQFGLTAPIATVLKSLEATIDSFANAMIAMLPTCNTASVQTDQSNLDGSVGNAISTYEQFCIPSPLYPTIQPICLS